MRSIIAAAWIALIPIAPATAAVSVNIGINVPTYPRLVTVPGYPVYYAPDLPANYFFYDGLYWVFDGQNWYDSRWYNGPWSMVDPYAVPVYLLRVPVRYYHRPPAYFRGWSANAAPHWHEHYGHAWVERRTDWNQHWDRHNVPHAAPLPTYQRSYSGDRYPHQEAQAQITHKSYSYQPRDAAVQQRWQHHEQQRQEAEAGNPGHGNEARSSEARGHEGRGHDHQR
jgi:hypothetical protein